MKYLLVKLFVCLIVIFILPISLLAQEKSEDIFEAKVVKIIEENIVVREDGSKNIQQNLRLTGLNGGWQGRDIVYYGISDIDVTNISQYHEGDKVIVNATIDFKGNEIFYILDYVRRGNIYILVAIFVLSVVIVGGWRGVKSLISLVVTFFIIMWLIVPQILAGGSPLIIGVVGSFLILFFIVYLTEGINKKSHIALVSILLSLIVIAFLSVLFTNLLKLSGTSQEETAYLINLGSSIIDFRGLLLASILIGALGVLDDVVVGQVEAVSQLIKANVNLSKKMLFKMSYQIGRAHLGAMVNTLFLAYAGASLPLLLLFSLRQEPFISYSQVINHEVIAVEIARTLIGSIGLTLAIPITTFLAIYFYVDKSRK